MAAEALPPPHTYIPQDSFQSSLRAPGAPLLFSWPLLSRKFIWVCFFSSSLYVAASQPALRIKPRLSRMMPLASVLAFTEGSAAQSPCDQREQGHAVLTNALPRPQTELIATQSSALQEGQFVILIDQAGQRVAYADQEAWHS